MSIDKFFLTFDLIVFIMLIVVQKQREAFKISNSIRIVFNKQKQIPCIVESFKPSIGSLCNLYLIFFLKTILLFQSQFLILKL